LLAKATEREGVAAINARPSLGRMPPTHARTMSVTSALTARRRLEAATCMDPTGPPRAGAVPAVIVVSVQPPVTATRVIVPAPRIREGRSFRSARSTRALVSPGGRLARSNFR
jgi:hypothetical protein